MILFLFSKIYQNPYLSIIILLRILKIMILRNYMMILEIEYLTTTITMAL